LRVTQHIVCKESCAGTSGISAELATSHLQSGDRCLICRWLNEAALLENRETFKDYFVGPWIVLARDTGGYDKVRIIATWVAV
jgi:hypothetical protein